MRTSARLVVLGWLLASGAAFADRNDFRISQLGNPGSGANATPTANDNFRIFAREFSAALTSVNLGPPESLGHAAFAVNAELSVVTLESTQFNLPTEVPFEGPLLIPSVHIRKGLPFSFEVGSRVAWIDRSRMAAGTLEAKWALNEGFLFLPDFGVRASVTRLFNSREFDLTSAGLDLGLGKQFAVGGMVTLTPYGGWNSIWTAASSGSVDFNRSRTYAQSIASPTAQLQDTGVFDEVTLNANRHNRFYGGVRFVGGVVILGAEISYSNLGDFDAVDPANPAVRITRTLPGVLAYNVTFGLDF